MPNEIPHTHQFPRTRQPTPPVGSRTERFVEMVEQTHGRDFVASWLLPSLMIQMKDGSPAFQNCEFTNDTIFTTGVGNEQLFKRCEHLIEKADIIVRECPIIRAKFNAWGRKHKTTGGKK